MRIKFLSVIVSFLLVSFAITSCLDNDNTIEYSPDATIHAFGLDTVHGKHYRFTINQLAGEIYNQDSLPVGSDTIIDRILIDTLSTGSGIITMKSKEDQDSVINIADSINLSIYSKENPLKVKVWAPDLVITKEYKIWVNVHQQDPDSLNWGQKKGEQPKVIKTGFSNGNIRGKQKAVVLNKNLFVYAKTSTNQIIAYTTPTVTGQVPANGENWSEVTISGLPSTTDLTCMLQFNNLLYVVADGLVYYSQNGAEWQTHQLLNRNGLKTMTLLAAYPTNEGFNLNNTIGISAVVMDGLIPYFAMTNADATSWTLGTEEVSINFPRRNISSTVYTNNTGVQGAMLMGDKKSPREESEEEEDEEEEVDKTPIVPWGSYTGTLWADLSTSSNAFCPILPQPSIMHYGNDFYAFGNDFNVFYTSIAGIAWYEANKKFYFPKGLTDRAGDNYSMVIDENNFIWIMLSNSTSGTDDVWRGRLNKLGFVGAIKKVK